MIDNVQMLMPSSSMRIGQQNIERCEIQRPTTNNQRPTSQVRLDQLAASCCHEGSYEMLEGFPLGCWMLGVGRWAFNSNMAAIHSSGISGVNI